MSKAKTPRHEKRLATSGAKCPKHPKKEYRLLVRAAWEAGWWVERRRKYIYCFPPDKAKDWVKVPMTPSSSRTLDNVRRNFEASGLSL